MAAQTLTTDQVLAQLKSYCTDNYENGWADLVIETMDDAEIMQVLGKVSTLRGAIWKMHKHLETYASYRADIAATAF